MSRLLVYRISNLSIFRYDLSVKETRSHDFVSMLFGYYFSFHTYISRPSYPSDGSHIVALVLFPWETTQMWLLRPNNSDNFKLLYHQPYNHFELCLRNFRVIDEEQEKAKERNNKILYCRVSFM